MEGSPFFLEGGDGALNGFVLAVVSGLTYAFYIVGMDKKGLKSLDTNVVSFYMAAAVSAAMLLYNLPTGKNCVCSAARRPWADLCGCPGNLAVCCRSASNGTTVSGCHHGGDFIPSGTDIRQLVRHLLAGGSLFSGESHRKPFGFGGRDVPGGAAPSLGKRKEENIPEGLDR